MSVLTQNYPDYICAPDGTHIPIDTDFRVWVDFAQTAEQDDIDEQKAVDIFSRIFLGALPSDIDVLIPAVLGFFAPEHLKQKAASGGGSIKRIIDFDIDSGRIYAAFLSQYGIDLSTARLHWWAFCSLFNSLSDDTKLVQIMQYRNMTYGEINKMADKQQRNFYRRMKHIYDLPQNISAKDKEQALIDALSAAF